MAAAEAIADRDPAIVNLNRDPAWRESILRQPIPALIKAYPAEASIHKSLMTKRGTGVASSWRRFERFLADIGPMPGPDYELRFVYADAFSYGPGQVEWVERHKPAVYRERPAPPQAEYSQWATVGGQPVTYSNFVKSLGATFREAGPVLNAGVTPDRMVDQKSIAERNINPNASWLPPQPERREALLAAYRLWHLQVLPKFAEVATPDFLFLYIVLGQLVQARRDLEAADLFVKAVNRDRQRREDHPAWKKYCELLPKAQAALASIPTYNSYSLLTEMDDLYPRVVAAEARFRGVGRK